MTNDKELIIPDWYNVNQYSLEAAEVYYTSPWQTTYHLGDRVIVDFAIFTYGLYPELQLTNETRMVYEDEDRLLYWCHDGTDQLNSTEVFGWADGERPLPGEDFVFIEPAGKDRWGMNGSLHVPLSDDRDTSPFFATVIASSTDKIKAGDRILCEPAFSVSFKYRGQEYEYIKAPYILGKSTINNIANLQLF